MKRGNILLVVILAWMCCAVRSQRLKQTSVRAPQLGQGLSPVALSIPAEFAGIPLHVQSFQFPNGPVDFSKLCFKLGGIGTCVASSRCRSKDQVGSGRCRSGHLCCQSKDLISGATTPRTTTPPPTGPGKLQQLVRDCGKPRPSLIFFPSRAKVPEGGFTLQGSRLDSRPLSLRQRRSPLKRPTGLSVQAAPTQTPIRPVVGGTDVPVTSALPVGRWPWMALLGYSENGRVDWKCGGTVISASTILTAAHCVSNRRPGDITVRLGEYNIASSQDGRHTDTQVSRIIVHPDYRRSQNDIALLLLSKPVRFSSRIRPACLPPPNADHTNLPADLAGWGRLGFADRTSNVLQEATVVVVDEEECEKNYRGSSVFDREFPGGFQGTKICAGGADGASKDACQGDSGGPLVVQGSEQRYQVIGVVSTGIGCGNPQFPGVYTKVSKYIPWILENSS